MRIAGTILGEVARSGKSAMFADVLRALRHAMVHIAVSTAEGTSTLRGSRSWGVSSNRRVRSRISPLRSRGLVYCIQARRLGRSTSRRGSWSRVRVGGAAKSRRRSTCSRLTDCRILRKSVRCNPLDLFPDMARSGIAWESAFQCFMTVFCFFVYGEVKLSCSNDRVNDRPDVEDPVNE